MKNILIIDGAENCAYDIFAATDAEFALLFPAGGQDIAFIDEVVIKPARRGVSKALKNLWTRPVEKKDAHGIHGTIFYQLNNKKFTTPIAATRTSMAGRGIGFTLAMRPTTSAGPSWNRY